MKRTKKDLEMKKKIKNLKLLPEAKGAFEIWKENQMTPFVKEHPVAMSKRISCMSLPVLRQGDDCFVFTEFWVFFADSEIVIDVAPVLKAPREAVQISWTFVFSSYFSQAKLGLVRGKINKLMNEESLKQFFGSKSMTRKSFADLNRLSDNSLRWMEEKSINERLKPSNDDLTPLAQILKKGGESND